jgi:hypothetical protein
MASAFNQAWELLKALSREDLQHAARAGGLRMTPERMADYRQAYEEQGMTPTGAQIHSAPSLSYLGNTGNQSDANRLIAAQKINQRRGIQPVEDWEMFQTLPYDPLHPAHYNDKVLWDGTVQEYARDDETPMSEVNQERSWSPMGGMGMVEDVPTYDPEGPARIEQPRFPQANPARPTPKPPAPRRDVFKPIQTTPKVQVRPRRGGGPNSQRNRMMQRMGSQYHSRR